MFTLPDKLALKDLLIDIYKAKLNTLVEAATLAKEAATNEESKAENKYDTRGLEASYLAGAQAKMALDLKKQMAVLKRVEPRLLSVIDVSALFFLADLSKPDTKSENNYKGKWYYMLPVGGGEKIYFKNNNISIISLEAPLGKILLTKEVGDEVEFTSGGNIREYAVTFIY